MFVQVVPWHPWYVNKSVTNLTKSGEIPAGYATNYLENNLTFVTFRMAGHLVPQNAPAAALVFFARFLAGDPL